MNRRICLTTLVTTATLLAGAFFGPLAPLSAEDKKDPAPAVSKEDGKVAEPTPADKAHAEWLKKTLDQVQNGQVSERETALKSLIEKDKDGNCLKPLADLLKDIKPEPIQVEVVRALGRDQLHVVAPAIEAFLDSKNEILRANAAVSLEYIGSPQSVKPLLKQMDKEKVVLIQNHIARAVGRCGVQDDSARKALAKLGVGGKTEAEGLGAVIGLAYFEGNGKAARDLEKLMKKVGVPSFGRKGGGGQNTIRRMYLGWALGQIGDDKSVKFVDKTMLGPLENAQSPWAQPTRDFYFNVTQACQGDKTAKAQLKQSVLFVKNLDRDTRVQDDARLDRDMGKFEPLAEWKEGE